MAEFSSVPDKASGDTFTEAMWDTFIKDNGNKLGTRMHRQVTALPSDEENADEVYYRVDTSGAGGTADALWHFVYDSTIGAWVFVGGPPLFSKVVTRETRNNTSYGALTTAVEVDVPLAGDYMCHHGCFIDHGAAQGIWYQTVKFGSDAASDNHAVKQQQGDANTPRIFATHSTVVKKTGSAAGDTYALQYRNSVSNAIGYENRFIEVWPVSVSAI